MNRILLLVLMSLSFVVSAATTTNYDFSVRNPGTNIFSYEGNSSTQVPSSNSSPSSELSSLNYGYIESNNNTYHDYINYTKNVYPAIRYVIELDEAANTITELNVFWNGYGVNSKKNKADGVVIYIWNNNSNSYDYLTQAATDWIVELDHSVTSSLTDYVDSNNQVTVYVVSQEKTFNKESNWIGTDYFRLTVTSNETISPIANYYFDECTYTGIAFDALDQTGNYSATSQNSMASTATGIVERAADISDFSQHFTTSIPLPSDFTVSTWFKKPTSTSDSNIFALGAMQNGGDLLVLDRNNGWYWGIYDGTNTVYSNSYSFASLDDNWHHMVLMYQSGISYLVIDGVWVDTINRAPSGTLKYIGTSYDFVGTSGAQGFRAPLDEFMVFNRTLTLSEMQTIYNNQLADKNYDSSSRAAVQCGPVLVAHYSMDEASWGSVLDNVNNFHGSAFNGADTIGSTCRYGQFDGVDDYVQIPHDDLLNGSDALTYMAFVRADSWTGTDQIMAKSVHGGGSGRAQMGLFSENGVLKGRAETVNGRINISTALPLVAGDWVHLSLVFDGVSLSLYQDGVKLATTSFPATTLIQTTDPLNISKRVGTSSYYFHGLIDDVRVYSSALTTQEINDVIDSITLCSINSIDHYQIIHDSNGLTCDAETVTINACTNSSSGGSCSLATDSSVALDLVIKDLSGTEITRISGVTFDNGGTAEFSYTQVGDVYVSIENTSPSATEGFVCNSNTAYSQAGCKIAFANVGFEFTEVSSLEVAGKVFSQIKIKALKADNGVCKKLFSGNKTVNFAMEYALPNTATDKKYSIGGQNIAQHLQGQTSSYTPITLNFDSDATAILGDNIYHDAGIIKLIAQYREPASGNIPELLVTGSNDFSVRPYQFVISPKTSGGSPLTGKTDDDDVTQKAGGDFALTIEAVNEIGEITTNYTNQGVSLALERKGPTTAGTDGTLTYGSDPSQTMSSSLIPENFGSGMDVTLTDGVYGYSTTKFSEVGIYNLSVREFLDNGDRAIGSSAIGRFIPDHFSLIASSVNNACAAENFTYMDEPKFALNYQIAAMNADDIVTENYIKTSNQDFIHSTIELVAENNNVSELSNRLSGYQGDWESGIYDSIINNLGTFIRNPSNQPDGPFENLFIGIKVIDEDNSLLNEVNMAEHLANDSCIIEDTCTAKLLSVIKSNIRFGRWFIENTSGSENAALPQIMQAQYYNGSSFVTNKLDNCTTINGNINDELTDGDLHDPLPLLWDYHLLEVDSANSPIRDSHTNAEMNNIINQFEAGIHRGTQFRAPGSIGDLQWQLNVPAWMKYDWQNDGTHDDNPFATLSFGVYRGNDRIISWREVGN